MIHITTNTHEKPGDEILEGHGGLKKKGDHAQKQFVIPFIREFSHISPQSLEDILEWLEDHKHLSDAGKTFRDRIWNLFIKE